MEITPKKSLGQHWLTDATVLDAITNSAELSKQDTVLEIGPGIGTLTAKLADRAEHVVAIELDQTLVESLVKQVAGNVTVIHQDIRTFDLTTMTPGYKIVANIPYYLTSYLLRVLCESVNPFAVAVLLVQKEVAERVNAKPGSMSMLSVSVRYYCDVQLGQVVPAKLFNPPPKVDSQILILHKRREALLLASETKQFFQIVKAGFSQRRKTLHNALSGGLRLSREDVARVVHTAGLPPVVRAQDLSLSDWVQLLHAYKTTSLTSK